MGRERIKPVYDKLKKTIKDAGQNGILKRHETIPSSRSEFIPLDTPLTRDEMLKREDYMMDTGNWRGDHSVPSEGPHYRYLWLWDSSKAAGINARRGQPDKARIELQTLEKYRDPHTGFLANKLFATATGKTFRDYPEALYFNRPEIGSSYTQPPLQAWAAMETYKSYVKQNREEEGKKFLQEIYGTALPENHTGLQGQFAYLVNHRQNSEHDPLVGIIHPHETGRDSDRANKPESKTIFTKKPLGHHLETARLWIEMEQFGHAMGKLGRDPEKKRIDWLPEKVRGKYWINDVMFNALYVRDLTHMAKIGKILEKPHDEIYYYNKLATKVENQILSKMWNQEKGFFYNLDKEGKQIPVDSITGLFPLMLPNISEEQLEALRSKLHDPTWFATTYRLPTHATRSEFYDPHYTRKNAPPWEGEVWLDMNYFLVEEGLMMQHERFSNPASESYNPQLAQKLTDDAKPIVEATEKLLSINKDTYECYDPDTGKGYRVKNFMWSNLGLHFDNYRGATKKK